MCVCVCNMYERIILFFFFDIERRRKRVGDGRLVCEYVSVVFNIFTLFRASDDRFFCDMMVLSRVSTRKGLV